MLIRNKTQNLFSLVLMGLFFLCAIPPCARPQEGPFPNAHDQPPPGWTGPVFKLRQDYPATKPVVGSKPWKAFDFKTQSIQYLKSVLAYCIEGNVDVDFQLEKNTIRNWYHAPWLHTTNNGREFVHGLTGERSSKPRELDPNQTDTFANWAVGMYNAPGGFVIGQVWKDPNSPNPAKAIFPDGTVSCKLLFTTAPVSQVPYLQNSLEWQADVSTSSGGARSVQTVRLLQVDVAVRESRANATTGWVFGTFVYDGNATGQTLWDRLVPVGLMWGNDPNVTEATKTTTTHLTQTFINPSVGPLQHLGRAGRLNGPVDNPRSSCLSCHSTAEWEAKADNIPAASNPDAMSWFRNIKATRPFTDGERSLGYSLQLAIGIERFHAAHPSQPIGATVSPSIAPSTKTRAISRGGEEDNN
jgi:hypothetical protein